MKVGATEALEDLSQKITEVIQIVVEAGNILHKINTTNQIEVTLTVVIMVINHFMHHVTNTLTNQITKIKFPHNRTTEIEINLKLVDEVMVVYRRHEEKVPEILVTSAINFLNTLLVGTNQRPSKILSKSLITIPNPLNLSISEFNLLTN